MRATVLVERVGKRKFRATTAQPVPMESEGASQKEALERLQTIAKQRLAAGQLVQMDLADVSGVNPWKAFAGVWKDHSDFEAFRDNIAEYRQAVNQPKSKS